MPVLIYGLKLGYDACVYFNLASLAARCCR